MKLSTFSYLIKVPLALCIVSFASAIGVFLVTYYLLASYVSGETLTRMQQIANSLAQSARQSIYRDELWDLHQQIQSIIRADAGTHVMILTDKGQVLIASDAMTYPVLGDPTMIPTSIRQLSQQVQVGSGGKAEFELTPGQNDIKYAAATSVQSEDGDSLGSVIVFSDQDAILPKFRVLLSKVIGYGGLALAIVIPLGWWLGRKLVQPLNTLKASMQSLPSQRNELDRRLILISSGTDEISQLAAQFISMHNEILRSRDLEDQIQAAERMAFTGRIASALAHEVNNPLGGMMNVISNLRLRGISDPFVEKTANLLDRGLKQIGESIAALMSQSRKEHTLLNHSDIDDLQILSSPAAHSRHITVKWDIALGKDDLPIRAVPVRQIVLNLVLNAVNAAASQVHVIARIDLNQLIFTVTNDGLSFSAAFEPVPAPDRQGRTGLGLWVSFRLTNQLGGSLHITPGPNTSGTVAKLTLPLGEKHGSRIAG
jgi:signal transduction histidine kinase